MQTREYDFLSKIDMTKLVEHIDKTQRTIYELRCSHFHKGMVKATEIDIEDLNLKYKEKEREMSLRLRQDGPFEESCEKFFNLIKIIHDKHYDENKFNYNTFELEISRILSQEENNDEKDTIIEFLKQVKNSITKGNDYQKLLEYLFKNIDNQYKYKEHINKSSFFNKIKYTYDGSGEISWIRNEYNSLLKHKNTITIWLNIKNLVTKYIENVAHLCTVHDSSNSCYRRREKGDKNPIDLVDISKITNVTKIINSQYQKQLDESSEITNSIKKLKEEAKEQKEKATEQLRKTLEKINFKTPLLEKELKNQNKKKDLFHKFKEKERKETHILNIKQRQQETSERIKSLKDTIREKDEKGENTDETRKELEEKRIFLITLTRDIETEKSLKKKIQVDIDNLKKQINNINTNNDQTPLSADSKKNGNKDTNDFNYSINYINQEISKSKQHLIDNIRERERIKKEIKTKGEEATSQTISSIVELTEEVKKIKSEATKTKIERIKTIIRPMKSQVEKDFPLWMHHLSYLFDTNSLSNLKTDIDKAQKLSKKNIEESIIYYKKYIETTGETLKIDWEYIKILHRENDNALKQTIAFQKIFYQYIFGGKGIVPLSWQSTDIKDSNFKEPIDSIMKSNANEETSKKIQIYKSIEKTEEKDLIQKIHLLRNEYQKIINLKPSDKNNEADKEKELNQVTNELQREIDLYINGINSIQNEFGIEIKSEIADYKIRMKPIYRESNKWIKNYFWVNENAKIDYLHKIKNNAISSLKAKISTKLWEHDIKNVSAYKYNYDKLREREIREEIKEIENKLREIEKRENIEEIENKLREIEKRENIEEIENKLREIEKRENIEEIEKEIENKLREIEKIKEIEREEIEEIKMRYDRTVNTIGTIIRTNEPKRAAKNKNENLEIRDYKELPAYRISPGYLKFKKLKTLAEIIRQEKQEKEKQEKNQDKQN